VGKVLLRCVCSAARDGEKRDGAGAYCVATRTACFHLNSGDGNNVKRTMFITVDCLSVALQTTEFYF